MTLWQTHLRKSKGAGPQPLTVREMTRVLAEQGVDAAIDYAAAKRSSILETAHARTATAHERNRAELQPLLQAAALYGNKGQSLQARTLYAEVLAVEPDWPVALYDEFGFLVSQGDAAGVRTTLADARREFEEALRVARRLNQIEPNNPDGLHALSFSHRKLGEVSAKLGDLEEVQRRYGESYAVADRAASAAPANAKLQRERFFAQMRLGDVALTRDKLNDADAIFRKGLEIARNLAILDPASTDSQRSISIAWNRIGDLDDGAVQAPRIDYDQANMSSIMGAAVSRKLLDRRLIQAAGAYGEGLAVARKLAEISGSNVELQRDHLVACNKLGDVAAEQSQLPEAEQVYLLEAERNYLEGLDVARKLVAIDPTNAAWQRDLSISWSKLGDLASVHRRPQEAANAYRQALSVFKTLAALDRDNTERQAPSHCGSPKTWGSGRDPG